MEEKIYLSLILFVLLSCTGFSQPVYLESGKINLEAERSPQVQTVNDSTISKPVLIQFNSTTSKEYRESLEGDIIFHEYIPENTWLSTSKLSLAEIESIKRVDATGIYRSSYRKDPSLDLSQTRKLKVSTIGNISAEKINDFGEILEKRGPKSWKISVNKSSARSLISQGFVRKVEKPEPPLRTFNLESRRLVGADTVQVSPYNLTGNGFTAALWDKGWAGKHIDLNQTGKRIIGDEERACGGCEVLEHGTHVAGTLLGSGIQDSDLRGVASGSRLLTFEWPGYDSSGNYSVDYVEETENEVNKSIKKYDAVVSQNSWGYTNGAGDYFGLSEVYDSIISGRNSNVDGRLTTVFSVGNIRDNVSRDYNTTFPPATAKNVIAVGAVDDNGSMTSYSSWGPTDDGRIKPDLVADGGCGSGTYVTSTVPGNGYSGKCGTSMAAPAVSGGVLLLNQGFNRTYGRLPEPATVKGILLHTSKDLYSKGPDYKTGWGLLDVEEAVKFTEKSAEENLIRTGSLDTGENHTYTIERSKNSNLEITLVWDDPKSTTGTKTLVNDLDLSVKNKQDEKIKPWTLNWSKRGEGAYRGQDHRNNVEQVLIEDSNSSRYNITVEGWSVPKNPQNYSLILNRYVDNTEPTAQITSPVKGNLSGEVNVSATWKDNYSEVLNASVTTGRSEKITKSLNTTLNTSRLQDGSQILRFSFKDSKGNTLYLNRSITVDNTPPVINTSLPRYVKGNLSLAANITDETTEVIRKNVKIKNSSYGENQSINGSLETENLSDGNYSVVYSYSDSVGNTDNRSYSITVDNTDPKITINSPEKTIIKENLTASFTVKEKYLEQSNLTLIKNSTDIATGRQTLRLNSSNISDGNYTVNYFASDAAGNSDSRKLNITYNAKPRIQILSPDKDIYGDSPVFNISTGEEIDSIRISDGDKNSSTVSENSYFLNTSLESKNRSNRLRIYLKEGNLTWSENLEYFVDRKPPEFKVKEPQKLENISNTLNISLENITETTEIKKINLSTNNYSKTIEKTSEQLNLSKLDEKTYNLSIKAYDRFENSKKTSRKIRVDREAPSLRFYRSNLSYISETTQLNASSRDNGSGVYNLTYILYNDNFTLSGSMNTSLNTSEIPDGNYSLSIVSRDYSGNTNTSSGNIIIDTEKPEIKKAEPTPGTAVETITYLNISLKELSGITQASEVRTTSGSLRNLKIRDKSITGELTDLNPGEEFDLSLRLSDHAENSRNKTLTYSVKESDSGGGSSGSGSTSSTEFRSFSEPVNTTDTAENTTKASMKSLNSSREEKQGQNSQITFKPGKNVEKVDDSSPVKSIDVRNTETVSVSITETEKELQPPESTQSLEDFNFSMNSSVTSLNLTFEVSKEKINRTQVSEVDLYRRNNSKWQRLDTVYLNSSNKSFLFRSEIPGFSPFTIALSENISAKEYDTAERENSSEDKTNVSTTETEQKEPDKPYTIYLIGISAILILGYIFARRRHRKTIESRLNIMREESDSAETMYQLANSKIQVKKGRLKQAENRLENTQDRMEKRD